MSEIEASGELGANVRIGSFKIADAATTDAAGMAFVLDQMAGRPAVQALKAWALEQLAPQPGETAVDVGSGTGEDVVAFADLGLRAIGVEPSAGLRAEAVRRSGPSEVEFVEGLADKLPFDDESVDVVRCERVLQHVEDPAGSVREMARVLRPGGRIVLIDTDWQTAIIHPADPEVLQRMVGSFLAQSANPYSGRQLRGQLVGAGLEIAGESAATWLEPQSGARQGFISMMHARAFQSGAITAAEAEAFAKGITEAADRGAFHMSLTMYAVSAVKAPVA
ncbi:methyltransferase domain-containing protein [Kribbella antibiotica]|uniref:Methyltransferase domain-containing protein n=1 Tax=Kribbella antibiotica TaxID=190195 RepID=A0A4R4ZLD9_9ACTN|nr:methyltransferase domain-containing protein [Kribbella antibiotica]TDD59583.1 methyltransferase domain-containing protein [Kribbella antibiotica]